MSETAEEMLSRCLAVAVSPEIQVNNVEPGLMDTRAGRLLEEAWWDMYTYSALLKRMLTVDDVADAVLYSVCNDSVTA